MIIKILIIPEGPAPLWVREAWLMVEMPAKLLSSYWLEVEPVEAEKAGAKLNDFVDEQHVKHILDICTHGTSKGSKGCFFVTFDDGIKALEDYSLEAVNWLKENWPNRSRGFVFGSGEAIVVEEGI